MTDAIAAIRLLVLDVDGVLTDGGIVLDDAGMQQKRFHVHDGCGIRMWSHVGHKTAIITGRTSGVVEHRARELAIDAVVQGVSDKAQALTKILSDWSISKDETAVIGDDLPDLPMFKMAGYPIAVQNATAEVTQMAAFTTTRQGGNGAVREAIEHLLKGQNRWNDALDLWT